MLGVAYCSNRVALEVSRTAVVLHVVVFVEVVLISTAVAALVAMVLRTSTAVSHYCCAGVVYIRAAVAAAGLRHCVRPQ